MLEPDLTGELAHADLIPTAHQTDLIPTAHQTDLIPAAHQTDLIPTAHQTDLIPTAHQADLIPAAHQTDLIPIAHQADLIPAAHQTNLIPTAHQTDLIPTAHQTDLNYDQIAETTENNCIDLTAENLSYTETHSSNNCSSTSPISHLSTNDNRQEVPTHGRYRIPKIRIDRGLIPQANETATSSADNPLKGVCVYEQSTFERSLINQFESQMQKHLMERKARQRRIKANKNAQIIPNDTSSNNLDSPSSSANTNLLLPLYNNLNSIDKFHTDVKIERNPSLVTRPLSPIPSSSSDSDNDDSEISINSTYSRNAKSRKNIRHKRQTAKKKLTDEEIMTTPLSSHSNNSINDCGHRQLTSGLTIPNRIWNKLFIYQQEAIEWLWHLHLKQIGGLLGDEMGLGKTIQIISFLSALHYSQLDENIRYASTEHNFSYSGSTRTLKGLGHVLVVCPATLLRQWMREFQTWAPDIKVVLLHSAGASGMTHRATLNKALKNHTVVIITSYQMLRILRKQLLKEYWHYAILDEVHRIRNPDADITLVCKQIRTPHRIGLSGCPIQNNLKELWSLIDFVSPAVLGTLPVFLESFAIPITAGGYSSASEEQVQTAYRCACILRDSIKPILLRRVKDEVVKELLLPDKQEQVLFCRPTHLQILLYKHYLSIYQSGRIYRGGGTALFVALCILRKICNHPDIVYWQSNDKLNNKKNREIEPMNFTANELYQFICELRKRRLVLPSCDPDGSLDDLAIGHYSLAGKMRVLYELLKVWSSQNHKVLLFSQSRLTLDILEQMVRTSGYSYLRMDGSTTVASRAGLVNRFNEDRSIFIFLLTTRVGGLGLNLTGANRVVIYDPDWNPSTDQQAKERAWRIGQNRGVIIFRLVTSGTIEEKMYQRQIFKHYLTNRILKNPSQKRLFSYSDVHELFKFDDSFDCNETMDLLSDITTGVTFQSHTTATDTQITTTTTTTTTIATITTATNFLNDTTTNEAEELVYDSAGHLGTPPLISEYAEQPADIESVRDAWSIDDLDKMDIEDNSQCENTLAQTSKEFLSHLTANHLSGKSEIVTIIKKNSNLKGKKFKSKHKSISNKKRPKFKPLASKNVDGHEIIGVDNQTDYNILPQAQCKTKINSESELLNELFKHSSLQSALKHDILDNDDTNQRDHTTIQSTAKKTAESALKALERSRQQLRDQPLGVPTWTGQNGGVPLLVSGSIKINSNLNSTINPNSDCPKNSLFSGRDVISESQGPVPSSELLDSIRMRNQYTSVVNSATSTALDQATEILMKDIHSFISLQLNQRTTTDEIINKFSYISNEQTPLFKAILNQMCYFSRYAGDGIWKLKTEFS